MVVSDERKYVKFWDQRANYNIFFVQMKGRCICNVYLLGINNWLFQRCRFNTFYDATHRQAQQIVGHTVVLYRFFLLL